MNFKKILLQLAVVGSFSVAAHAGSLVVVGNPAAAAMTKDQVADIYLGKSQAATPLDQVETGAVYADFYKAATGRDVAQVKSTWSRIVFSGKGQPPKQLPDNAAVKKAVAADPKAIGYIEKSAVDSSVKVLLDLN